MSIGAVSPYKKVALVVGVLLLSFLLWYFSSIVVYIVISLFLSLLGRPVQYLLRKIKIGKWRPGSALVATVTLVVLLFLIGGFIYVITPAIVNQFANISSYSGGEVSDILRYPIKDLEDSLNAKFPSVDISFKQMLADELQPLLSMEVVKNTVGHVVTMAADIAMGIFCVSFITFFFLQDEDMFASWIKSLVPDEYVSGAERALDSIYKLQVRYMVGITIESIIKFLFLFIAFWAFGLHADTAAVASLFCAILNVIPYVGPIIGGVLAVILGVLSVPYGSQAGELIVEMTAALLIFQVIDNILLQPYIYASSVKAHPLEIFIVIIMAGNLAGVLGMLLAIPTYTILRVIAKEFFGSYKVVRELTTNL